MSRGRKLFPSLFSEGSTLFTPGNCWSYHRHSGIMFCFLAPSTTRAFSAELLPSQAFLSPYYCRVLSLSKAQDMAFGALLAHELYDRTVLPAVKFPLNGILGHSSGHLNLVTSTNKLRIASSRSQIYGLNRPGLSSVPCADPQCPGMSH